jgi:hypothetical protein
MYYVGLQLKCKYLFILQDPNATIGQRDGFSAKDIEKLAKMYENLSFVTTTPSDATTSYATRSPNYSTRLQFIIIIIITLNVLTHLQ